MKTPLFNIHAALGAKMTDFGGWELPVFYTGILEETKAVRNFAGIFDVSHMGEIVISGSRASELVQRIFTNDVLSPPLGKAVYSLMCNESGKVVDDVVIYRVTDEYFFIVVNAGNTRKDFEWIKDHMTENVKVSDISEETAQIAVQGPTAEKILQKLTTENIAEIGAWSFKDMYNFAGFDILLSRTGYTGEDGFEIYAKSSEIASLWEKIMEAGKTEGLMPCGLGARDALRLEAALPLYGHELSEEISPLEAGLLKYVNFEKGNFVGKTKLLKEKSDGVSRKLAGFEIVDKGIARESCLVISQGVEVGIVTSGIFSPSTGKSVGLMLISSESAKIGDEIEISVRDRLLKASIVKTPFVEKKYKKN